MQAARALMLRSCIRSASPLLCKPSAFTTAASHRSSSLVASLSVRRFATGPSIKGHTGPHPTGGEQTPQPNPFASKPSHETNTSTAVPTTQQSSATGTGVPSSDSQPSAAAPANIDKHERLPDSEPYKANWVDFRPNLVEVKVIRNEEGDLIGQWEGEEVIFPDLETSLEWVLSTPVDTHLFEEVPIIKECPDTDQLH